MRISDRSSDVCSSDLEANIIKLPNISASGPQMKTGIKELQAKGFALPAYPDEPRDESERETKSRYDKVKGSAVNPVLREGNSDRRAPASVKAYARKHPHRMGKWEPDSKTHVAHMDGGDFYGSEQSVEIVQPGNVRIELEGRDGRRHMLRTGIAVQAGELIDAAVMDASALSRFVGEQIDDARAQGVLFSLHLKATMMKVSDPIMFGIAVEAFYKPVLDKHRAALDEAGFDSNNGIGVLYARLPSMPADVAAQVTAEIDALYGQRPGLAMVNSDKGITNLHVPSDIIVDASMPAMIRDSGRMWTAAGELQDTKALITDRSYAGIYQTVVADCKANDAFDPSTMGSVPTVGPRGQQAEANDSQDKTFHHPPPGPRGVTTRDAQD